MLETFVSTLHKVWETTNPEIYIIFILSVKELWKNFGHKKIGTQKISDVKKFGRRKFRKVKFSDG